MFIVWPYATIGFRIVFVAFHKRFTICTGLENVEYFRVGSRDSGLAVFCINNQINRGWPMLFK
jgi:hypothetical protein